VRRSASSDTNITESRKKCQWTELRHVKSNHGGTFAPCKNLTQNSLSCYATRN
jgi:hypothetical protein